MARSKFGISATERYLLFMCPGCDQMHGPRIEGGSPTWHFNGDLERPTISPSVLVRWTQGERHVKQVCHSFVRDGRIQFLTDCTHALAGKTVDLPELET